MPADQRRSSPSQLLACAALAVLLISAAVPSASIARGEMSVAHGPGATLWDNGLLVAGAGPCVGGYVIAGSDMCTHGSDPIPDPIEERGGPARLSATAAAEAAAVGCDGDGVSGERVQALYVYVAGRANRKSQFVSSFRAWAANVDAMFMASAQETGSARRLRWVTNRYCLLQVPAVAVSDGAETNFGMMMSELAARGYDRNDRKYLVWFDSDRSRTSMCGIASLWGDDGPSASNMNNQLTGYARIDHICWDWAEQHEMMHTLGAVQTSAPNATRGLHCTDEYDQMCYPDAADVVVSYRCAARYERLFDCNHDDYFHTAPVAGSYLDTHWNAASSDWLIGPEPPAARPANDDLAAAEQLAGRSGSVLGLNRGATGEPNESGNTPSAAPIGSVWYAWTPSEDGNAVIDTCGSDFDTTLGAYTGTAIDGLTAVAANDDDPSATCGADSRLQIAVDAGTRYLFSVDGASDAQGTLVLNHELHEPSADLSPPVVQPPAAEIAEAQRIGRTAELRVSWPAAEDATGVARYDLERRKGVGPWNEVALSSPAATSADVPVRPGVAYSFRLRAYDHAGNISAWTTTPVRLAALQETSTSVVYVGSFTSSALKGASGGYVRHASVAGRSATLTFSGRSVAFVTSYAKKRGIVEVRLDGGAWRAIDLYAGALATRHVVWAAPTGPGTHTLAVRVTGSRNPAASSRRIDVDGFLVLS